MPDNLLVDGVRPVWVAVGPSEDMLPDNGLCPTTGHTLWAKRADQQAIAAGTYHQLLAAKMGVAYLCRRSSSKSIVMQPRESSDMSSANGERECKDT